MFVVSPLCRRGAAQSGLDNFIFSGNETLDGKKSIFEHSNLTVTTKSEIKLEVNRQLLGRLFIFLFREHSTLLLFLNLSLIQGSLSNLLTLVGVLKF